MSSKYYWMKFTFDGSDASILRDNPTRSVKQLGDNDVSFHVASHKEGVVYFLACPQPLQDVARLILETGMRCGEVYRIRRDEVFLDQGFLKVTKAKTKASIRRVHLSTVAREVLSSRMDRFDGLFLFPQNDIDGGLETKSLDCFHLRTIRALGFDFRLYDFRHAFATRDLESGVDLVTLASILGHAKLKMVMQYAHPSEGRKAEAIRHMEKRLANQTRKAA